MYTETRSSGGDGLPSEVVEDILSRLPVESLMRFKCVCQSWLSLFNEPSFVSLHLSHSNNDNNILFSSYCDELFSLSNDENNSTVRFSLKQVPILKLENATPFLRLSNSCNGIVCLYGSDHHIDDDVALCNPATREFRVLPKSETNLKISGYRVVLNVGIGYDYITNDYTVVRVLRHWNPRYVTGYVAEEYALSIDSWRRIDCGSPCLSNDEFVAIFDFAMHFKGVYYWWVGVQSSDLPTTLVTLNVGGGTFQKVLLPHPIGSGKHLSVLNGSVSLVCFDRCGESTAAFDIWVMDGGSGESCQWTRLQRITTGPLDLLFEPLGFWKGSELLIATFWKLGFFNIDSEEFQYLDEEAAAVKGGQITDITDYRTARIYVKSLVSIKERK